MNLDSPNPLVSVVITTYNRPALFKKALKSVLEQTYTKIEVIVVEDGSIGDIESWLRDNNMNHVKYFRHDKNQGLSAARNTGWKLAKGEYVAFLDDDDEWLPERIELGVKVAESCSGAVQLFYCGTIVVDEAEGVIIYCTPNIRGKLLEPLMAGWTPPPSTMFFRSTALQTIRGFDENLISAVDHDIWMSCAVARFEVEFVPEYLVRIVSRPLQERMTFDPKNRIVGVKGFMSKWRDEIEQALGPQGYRNFYNRYLSREYSKFGKYAIQANKRLSALKYYLSAIRHYPQNLNAWTNLLVVATGGRSLWRALRKLRLRFLPQKRYLEMKGLPGSPVQM